MNETVLERKAPWMLRPKFWIGAVISLVLLFVAGAVAAVYSRTQQDVAAAVASRQSVAVSGPITISLSQEVVASAKPIIEPTVSGTWSEERTLLGVKALKFRPAKRFQAGQGYRVRVAGLKRVVTGSAIEPVEISFQTQKPAEIKSVSPTDGAKDLPVVPRLKVSLTTPNSGVRDLVPEISPAVPLKLVSTGDQEYVWIPETPLKQGEKYQFVIRDMYVADPAKQTLATTHFQIVTQPQITSARTGGYFVQGQTIEIVFDQPMEPDTTMFLFDTPGKTSWKNATTLEFRPSALKPGETHFYKVKTGLKSKLGGALEADRDFSFSTNGRISGNISPGGSENALSSPIRVSFDQAVDHASAQEHFSIGPAVAGAFSWSGNTMIYTTTGLSYQTTYTVSVAPGVTPSWGLPNAQAIAGSFSTALQTIKLGVPLYKQSFSVTCEVTALKMALEYRGVKTTEMDIVGHIGYNPRPRDTATNTWDNPNEMFVGVVTGSQNVTGYGVHAPPIAAAAKLYGRESSLHYGLTAQFIATQIHGGNPVIFWGHSYAARADSWNTPSGVVQTWQNSHARVVVGVKGRPDAPVGFYINDSWGGRSFYWSTAELMNNINVLGGVSNMGVVVY